MRGAAGMLMALTAMVAVAAAHATSPSPSDQLAQAEQQTARAKSMHIGMTMTIRQGGHSVTIEATGRELPGRRQASLDMDLSKLSPSAGTEKVLMVGSKAYVHLAILSTPAAKKKGLKPWITEDASSVIGIDPWSLGGSAQPIQGIRAAGFGVDDGVRVTRYAGTVALRKALASNPQFQKVVQTRAR